MTAYIPGDHPQTTGAWGTDKATLKHKEDYLAFGPPPRDYWVQRDYATVGTKWVGSTTYGLNGATTMASGASKHHPCSPTGLKTRPATQFPAEFALDRKNCRGFFHPPFQYVPGQMMWQHHESWEEALLAAYNQKHPEKPLKIFNIHGLRRDVLTNSTEWRDTRTHILHHPADRDTVIFKDETMVSLMAYLLGHSLVIVCPLVNADGVGWSRIWDKENRPPIYTRWSTGKQAISEPLVLMCLPQEETPKGRESFNRPVHWFNMKPRPGSAFERTWTDLWRKHTNQSIISLQEELRLSCPRDAFVWLLVFLHRRIALGAQIEAGDMLNWLQQYLLHLSETTDPKTKKWKPKTFKLDNNRFVDDRGLTYDKLTAWILKPIADTAPKYANLWDEAIQAMINYNLDRNDGNWTAVQDKMMAARKPWWVA